MSKQLSVGQRVRVQLPKSYAGGRKTARIRYTGVITKQGYRDNQWVVKHDLDGREEMIHESFILAMAEAA